MTMHLPRLISRLARNAATFRSLLEGLDRRGALGDLVRWSPTPGKWSLLLVVNHLADEERDDFKVRLDHTLHRPGVAWPGIDPEGWVTSRDYAAQDFDESLGRFLEERERSLSWLEGLDSPDWSATYEHPVIGTLSAGDLMAAWVDHDHQHMRQVLGLLHGSLCADVKPYDTSYAGEW
jgi:hypothetical protein